LNSLEFSPAIALAGGAAGFLGALTGLGGGGVITPVPTLLFGVDIRYAIGASLVSVIATSSGAASAFLGLLLPIHAGGSRGSDWQFEGSRVPAAMARLQTRPSRAGHARPLHLTVAAPHTAPP
jgi:hypothetical protein